MVAVAVAVRLALGRWLPMAPGVLRIWDWETAGSKGPRFRLPMPLASRDASELLFWPGVLGVRFGVLDVFVCENPPYSPNRAVDVVVGCAPIPLAGIL